MQTTVLIEELSRYREVLRDMLAASLNAERRLSLLAGRVVGAQIANDQLRARLLSEVAKTEVVIAELRRAIKAAEALLKE